MARRDCYFEFKVDRNSVSCVSPRALDNAATFPSPSGCFHRMSTLRVERSRENSGEIPVTVPLLPNAQ